MRSVEYVSHQQVYDLVFCAKNARLNSVMYALDFLDWVKAGVAFNTRGCEITSRKISYFAQLYTTLRSCSVENVSPLDNARSMFSDALLYFYEDIYSIYQDHLSSKQQSVRGRGMREIPDFGELIILPTFGRVPFMSKVFETVVIDCESYVSVNEAAFIRDVKSAYLKQDTTLYKCMSIMYDYGLGRVSRDKLLEVKVWNKAL